MPVIAVSDPADAVIDVVFLHGLDGDAQKSWSADGGPGMPQWLGEHLPRVGVYTVGYAASATRWRRGRALPIVQRATNLLAEFQNKEIGTRPVCLVTHSMGGLIAKEMVLQSKDGAVHPGFAEAIRGVVFMATPHQGSNLATVLDGFRRVARATTAAKDLAKYSPHLADAAFRYRSWSESRGIEHLVFFETYKTKNAVMVVDQGSADPGFSGVRPIPVDADHIQICKPVDRGALVYGQIVQFVGGLLAAAMASETSRTDEALSGQSADSPSDAGGSDGAVGVQDASKDARGELRPDILPLMPRPDLVGDLAALRFPQVVLGEGGLGKSVIAGEVFDYYNATRPTLLVLCSRIPGNTPVDTPDAVDSAFGKLLDPDAANMSELVTRFTERPVLIIDTVDLLLRDETADAIGTLFARLASVVDLVVTCREREWHDLIALPTPFETFRLPRLGKDAVLAWAAEFTGSLDTHGTRAEALQENLRVALGKRRGLDVLGVPLRLAMVCRLYAANEGLPDDLTVSRLYQDYWESRVQRDRRGRQTEESLRTERAALTIAERIWAESVTRFVEDVPTLDADHATSRRRLLSEGVLKETGLRASFFHQTFAEFAVAKHLAHRASDVDWERLTSGLVAARSGYWGVTTHLVAEQMSPDRARAIYAAIPRGTVEGVRLLLKAAFAHAEDVEDAAGALAEILRDDTSLVVAASDTLADAPAPMHPVVMDAIVALTASSATGITGLVRAGADLIRFAADAEAARFFDALLDALLSRGADSTPDVAPDFQRLMARVLENPMNPARRNRLLGIAVGKYEAMPRSGRAALLAHVAALEPGSPVNRTLTDIATKHDLPEQGADDAAILLARDWNDLDTRAVRGWTTWWELLAAPLPTRWDSALVRVFAHLAHDITGVLTPLIEETVRPTRNSAYLQDRLINASKYAADQEPHQTIAIMLQSPFADSGNAISSASQLARHLEGHLSNQQRSATISGLIAGADHNPGKAWPSILKLATSDDDLLDRTLGQLETRVTDNPDIEWRGTVHRTLDGLIQAVSSQQMVDLETRLATLGRLVGGIDEMRSARIAASIAPLRSSGRRTIDEMVDRRSGEFDNAAMTELARRLDQWPLGDWESIGLPWTVQLLRTRNQTAVGVIASMVRPYCVGPGWKSRYTGEVIARLLELIDADEDCQAAQQLTQVCADLVHDTFDTDAAPNLPAPILAVDVEKILDSYRRALTRGQAEAKGGKAQRQIAAVYSCLGDALTDVGKKVLDEDAFTRHVLSVTTDIDTQPIGGQASRGLADLLKSAVRTYPKVWAGLEAAWPDLSEHNQRAVAECALAGRVTNGRSVVLELVRRGCHASVAAYVHRAVGE